MKYKTREALLDRFNFKKVQHVMKTMDWKWVDWASGNHTVPSEERIKSAAEHLLSKLADGDSTSLSTGGLRAIKMNYNGVDYYSLMFCVENIEAGE